MSLHILRHFFFWCSVINLGLFILGFLSFKMDFTYRMQGRWYKMTKEQFNETFFNSMAIYKILITVFNVVPFFALLIVK